MDLAPLEAAVLPAGVRSRFVDGINGLRMHVLEAGFEVAGRPCVLLLHGFPELAYSWRKIMEPLAAAGYHVIAPDQRGYGRTTGWDAEYDGDLRSFRFLNLVRDMVALVSAFGYRSVAGIVGHDFGSPVAAYCVLARPDVFRSVTFMSAPFAGPPPVPFGRADGEVGTAQPAADIHAALAALDRPRKHYHWYYGTRGANDDMWHARQGVSAFLRAYYHQKSADWPGNQPFRLPSWTAQELAKMPNYYIMDLDAGMAETVAYEMPAVVPEWLPDSELAVYAGEYGRTGFQGGLQWYRCRTDAEIAGELEVFAGATIDMPSCFIAGRRDWGVRQTPGAFEKMQEAACTDMIGCHLLEGAGHWVQQEQPEAVSRLLVDFLSRA